MRLKHASSRPLRPETPSEVLVNLAEQHQADVLVVGNQGMGRRVLGSVPNTVSHKAACSMFVVKTS